jgi:outer membrane protein assembly factor BamB
MCSREGYSQTSPFHRSMLLHPRATFYKYLCVQVACPYPKRRRTMRGTLLLLTGVILVCPIGSGLKERGAFGSEAATATWPHFLGPNRDGISPETGLNLDWKKTPPKVLWRVPLGSGYSSLSVVGDRVFTTAKRGPLDVVVCLAAGSGKELWAHDAAPSYVDKQRQGAGPRATPTVHNGKVYCLMPMGELVCLRAEDGKRLWDANIFDISGARNLAGLTFYWGVSYSPQVFGDLLIVQPGGTKDNSVLAFHKDTGKLIWSVGDDPIGYASPVEINVSGQAQLVVPTGKSILGLEPKTGRTLWRYPFGNSFKVTCTNPLWRDGLLFVSAAYGGGAAAFEIRRNGDGWTVRENWKVKNFQNLFATSIFHDGRLYGCHGDLGAFQFRCLDYRTGQLKWTQRIAARCTLLGVEGHLIVLDEGGTLSLVEANPDRFLVKGEIPDLLTYKSWAVPALAGGKLFLRDERQVLCLDLRK